MFAQILKSNMRVNLIGGKSEGLPIEHPAVICVDIEYRNDVKLHMKYDPDSNTFYDDPQPPEPEVPERPTLEDRMVAIEEAMLMIL